MVQLLFSAFIGLKRAKHHRRLALKKFIYSEYLPLFTAGDYNPDVQVDETLLFLSPLELPQAPQSDVRWEKLIVSCGVPGTTTILHRHVTICFSFLLLARSPPSTLKRRDTNLHDIERRVKWKWNKKPQQWYAIRKDFPSNTNAHKRRHTPALAGKSVRRRSSIGFIAKKALGSFPLEHKVCKNFAKNQTRSLILIRVFVSSSWTVYKVRAIQHHLIRKRTRSLR